MAVSIQYDAEGRLTVSGLECGCPCDHTTPRQDIYVGAGILDNVASFVARRDFGKNCVLVADNITYPLAGARVEKLLSDAGFAVTPCVIRRDGPMEPDERSCGEVLLTIQPETDFLVSVGSGSITDTTRINATRCRLPFVCVGTAPSMDGYTSAVAPLLLRGVKIHRAGVCPDVIVCDTELMRTAPIEMVRGGVGDVLGKYIAVADWKLGEIINDEPCCPVCCEIVLDAVERLMENIDEIAARSEKGIRVLTEGLLLAGLTVLIIGNTRAVASVEHNIAHYWEMMELLHKHLPAPAHGASVGAATLLCWPLFKRFAEEPLSEIDAGAAVKARIGREERVAWMLRAFGEEAGRSIMRDNEGDFLTDTEQERRVRRAIEKEAEIRRVIAEMPDFARVSDAMRRLGAPMTAADMGVDDGLRNLSMRCAKDYRTRYTLFKLIDECGLLEKYMAEYPLTDEMRA